MVVQHLRAQGGVSSIGLWGRSMGAVTALLYSHLDPDIAGMVSCTAAEGACWAQPDQLLYRADGGQGICSQHAAQHLSRSSRGLHKSFRMSLVLSDSER